MAPEQLRCLPTSAQLLTIEPGREDRLRDEQARSIIERIAAGCRLNGEEMAQPGEQHHSERVVRRLCAFHDFSERGNQLAENMPATPFLTPQGRRGGS